MDSAKNGRWIIPFKKFGRIRVKGSGGLMDKVSASQPWDRGFEPHTGHGHDYSYDTNTDWF